MGTLIQHGPTTGISMYIRIQYQGFTYRYSILPEHLHVRISVKQYSVGICGSCSMNIGGENTLACIW